MPPLSHGQNSIRVEAPRPDELPDGVAAQAAPCTPPEAAQVRRAGGRIAEHSLAVELGRRGGLARVARERKLRALETLGLRAVEGADLTQAAPFLADGEAFAQHEIARLAQTAGGGHCGAGPASMVQTAALQLAASRFLFSTGDREQIALASRLGDASRQNLAMAYELCCKEAKARPRDAMAELNARLGIGEGT